MGRGQSKAGGSLNSLLKKQNDVSDQMSQFVKSHSDTTSWTSQERQKYNSLLTQYRNLRTKISNERSKQAAKAKKNQKNSANAKTFVNSYGEATTRNITSASYQRSQRRINRAVLRNLGS